MVLLFYSIYASGHGRVKALRGVRVFNMPLGEVSKEVQVIYMPLLSLQSLMLQMDVGAGLPGPFRILGDVTGWLKKILPRLNMAAWAFYQCPSFPCPLLMDLDGSGGIETVTVVMLLGTRSTACGFSDGVSRECSI